MDNLVLSSYMKLFESLSLDSRLSLITAMTESVRNTIQTEKKSKLELLHELSGAWSDVDDELMIKDIYESRTISERIVNFDE